MELVIMAAGLGTRYGGLKQLDPIDENGNFIIDYSIFDAIRCGFDKVDIIIKKENYELFKKTIGRRIENYINVEYVFQDDPKFLPPEIPKERVAPLGTGHAIYCLKNVVKSPFVVVNADDFYGYQAFNDATKFVKENKDPNNFALVCFDVENTIYGDKPFNRGVCVMDTENNLTKIDECRVQKNALQKIVATNKSNGIKFEIQPSQKVSTNMFVFYPNFFKHLEKHFNDFLQKNKNNLLTAEFELPSAVTNLIDKKIAKIKVLKTKSKWFGVTYKEDKKLFKEYLNNEIKNNNYPKNLWQKINLLTKNK